MMHMTAKLQDGCGREVSQTPRREGNPKTTYLWAADLRRGWTIAFYSVKCLYKLYQFGDSQTTTFLGD